MTTTVARKRGTLEETLDRAGFSAGTVRLRALQARTREGKEYPQGRRFVLASRADEELLEELLGDNAGAVIFGTAGFIGEEGEIYPCRVRAKGKINLAFPGQRWRLRGKTWHPGLYICGQTIELRETEDKSGRKAWIGTHPMTGQVVFGFKLTIKPDADGFVRIKPEDGYALKPRLHDSWWLLAKPAVLEGAGERAMRLFDRFETAARLKETKRPDYRYAEEFNVLGFRTAFEILGRPRGGTTSIEEAGANGMAWFAAAEEFIGAPLQAALHPDKFPVDFTDEERRRATQIGVGIRQNAEEAVEWAREWLKFWLGRAARRRSRGLTATFGIPKPKDRPAREEIPLIERSTSELRGLLVKAVREPEALRVPEVEEPAEQKMAGGPVEREPGEEVKPPRRTTPPVYSTGEPDNSVAARLGGPSGKAGRAVERKTKTSKPAPKTGGRRRRKAAEDDEE